MLRKYWHVILIVVIILPLAVVVQYTKDTNDITRWVFNFLKEWAVIFGAVGALLLAVIAFWTIFRERRSKLANELYTWAKNSLRLILTSGETGTEQQIFDKLQSNLSMIHSEALVLIVDAAKFSDSVLEKVKSVISKCQDGTQLNATMENFEEAWQKLKKIAESIDEDLYWVIFETS